MAEDISSRVAWKLRKVIQGGHKEPQTRTGTARVQRRDPDGTVWVRLPGASIDTPVTGAVVANVAAGDLISYDLSGGRVSITGNASDPSAGTNTVRAVRKVAESARKVASKAQAIADAIGQHFFTDDNGVHVSTEDGNPTGERNILMNSLGILLRQGSAWLASFSDSAVAFYDGLGNAAENVVAQFGADGAVIGRSGESHMELDYHSLRLIDKEGEEYFEVEDMRGSEGYVIINDRFIGTSERSGFILTLPSDDRDYTVTVDGVVVTPTLKMNDFFIINPAPAIGAEIVATYKTSSNKAKSFTIGMRDEGVVGACSIAEGYMVVASGFISHAEGVKTVSSGACSHAEGGDTAATGDYSHAEGGSAVAKGVCSHAQNNNTKAGYDNQTAIGVFNANDSNNAFEVGNGTADDARSNAFAVGWNGDLTYQGTLHGATWQAGTSGTTAGGVTTLPSSGTYVLVTGHNSTPALNGIWIVRTGSSTAFKLAGGGNVTVAVSGTTLTVTTTAGTVNVYYQLCG